MSLAGPERKALDLFIASWEFGRLVGAVLDPHSEKWPEPFHSFLKVFERQGLADIAERSGVNRDQIRNWLQGKTRRPRMDNVKKFVRHATNLQTAADSSDQAVQYWGAAMKRGLMAAPVSGAQVLVPFGQRRPVAPPLPMAKLDTLPVSSAVEIDSITIGEGFHTRVVSGARLCFLPSESKLLDPSGNHKPSSGWAPSSLAACDALHQRAHLYVPRKFSLNGRRTGSVRLFICTDQIYEQAVDDSDSPAFTLDGQLGIGGIAAFIDRSGHVRPANGSEPAAGLGCAGIACVVAFDRGSPQYRSEYVLLIRRGIRDIDDVYLTRDEKPIATSCRDIAGSRFLFQSREVAGSSCDVFSADYNGKRMACLNSDEPSAWDGFQYDDREVASWIRPRHAQFFSCSTGVGFPQPVVREDPYEPLHGPEGWDARFS
jgi:DNA-binding phage protein